MSPSVLEVFMVMPAQSSVTAKMTDHVIHAPGNAHANVAGMVPIVTPNVAIVNMALTATRTVQHVFIVMAHVIHSRVVVCVVQDGEDPDVTELVIMAFGVLTAQTSVGAATVQSAIQKQESVYVCQVGEEQIVPSHVLQETSGIIVYRLAIAETICHVEEMMASANVCLVGWVLGARRHAQRDTLVASV